MSKSVIRFVLLLLVLAFPRPSGAEWLYALAESVNRLAVVDTSNLTQPLADIQVTGLEPSEVLVAIDFRPLDGQLYGLARKPQGSAFTARLYRIHMLTGVATPIGAGLLPMEYASVGFDFNPVTDQIRVVTSFGLNYRIEPETGRMVDGKIGEPGRQPDTRLPFGRDVSAIAFSNNIAGADKTTLWALDWSIDKLGYIGGIDGVPDSPNQGQVHNYNVPLTTHAISDSGFDINDPNDRGFLVLENEGGINQLYQMDIFRHAKPVRIGQIPYPAHRVIDIAVLNRPVRMYGLLPNKHLVTFNSSAPVTKLAEVTIIGPPLTETLQAIDVQPTTGDVYALGGSGKIYRVNPVTGNDTIAVGDTGLTWSASASVSFDPVTGQFHAVDTNGAHVRIDVTTTPATVVQEPVLHNKLGQTATGVVGIGFAFDPFAGLSIMYGIDDATDDLVRISETGLVTHSQPVTGELTTRARMGFTVDRGSNTVYATQPSGPTAWYLAQIDRGVGTVQVRYATQYGNVERIAVVPRGVLQFGASAAVTSERAGSVTVTVARTGSVVGPCSIDYTTQATGAAQANRDFTPVSGTLIFLDGEASKSITIPIVADDEIESASETFTVTLQTPTLGALVGTTSSMAITIEHDDIPASQRPTIAITAPTTEPTYEAHALAIDVAGTASDDRGVSEVTWADDRGHQGTAQGTTNWIIPAYEVTGDQPIAITVTVRDTDGQTSTDTITITPAAAASEPLTYVLAEGATGAFFDTDILLANPGNGDVPVTLTFLKEDGTTVTDARTLAPLSRTTVHVDEIPGLEATAASTVVTAASQIVVERTMRWSGAEAYGAHTEKAVESAARTWYFAEGSQGFFSTYLLLANPNASENWATVEYLREGESPVTRTYTLMPNARRTIDAGEDAELVNRSFGMIVTFAQPGVAERAMYFGTDPFWKGGHESAGVTIPSTSWFLAEGATGPFFETFILLSNPQDAAADVTLTFLVADGTPVTKTKTVPAHSRITVNIEQEDPALANVAVATQVSASTAIVVERAQYWPRTFDEWYEAHNSFGVIATARAWGLAEGRVGGPDGYETYILLANPGSTAATVQITFLRTSGAAVTKTFTVAAQSRLNVATGANGPVPELANEEFGARIESDQPIAVERAMYSSPGGITWSAGTNATATRLIVP